MATCTIYTEASEAISQIKVDWGNGYNYVYGEGYIGGQISESFSGYVELTAVPRSGYKFTEWVYRVGTTSSVQQKSTDNPFTYSGSNDIYIWADGEAESSDETDEWTLSKDTIGEISSLSSYSVVTEKYKLYRYKVMFSTAGSVSFYSEGDLDTIGYVTTDTAWSSSNGEPSSALYTDDDTGDGDNFKITFIANANTYYYFWFRCCDESDSGDITITIVPPNGELSAAISVVSVEEDSITVKVINLNDTYNSTRTVTWYIGTGTPTLHGTQTLSAYTSEGSEYSFSGLKSETTYYFYCVITGSGGSFSVTIPSSGYKDETTLAVSEAFSCYIYNGVSWTKYVPYIYTSSGWQKYSLYVHEGS